MKLKELIEQYGDYEVQEGFLDLLEKLKPCNVWELEIEDDYYVITASGDISLFTWLSESSEKEARSIGNVFLTREEAKFEVKRRQVYAIVKKYAHEFTEEEWENEKIFKFYPDFNYLKRVIGTGLSVSGKVPTLYFKSELDIRKAIDEVGEEDFIRYYLGVRNE